MTTKIKTYYDKLAIDYDSDRFANTYGQYLHTQEVGFLDKFLPKSIQGNCLDIACGTGRFLNYASHGIDFSAEMTKVAKTKHPDKDIRIADATQLPFENDSFDAIISFHFIMHLDKQTAQRVLAEMARILKTGGLCLLDIPSAKRRKLTGHKPNGWHAANSYSLSEIKEAIAENWELKAYQGLSFFPLHRIPKSLRSTVIGLDSVICKSSVREFASYMALALYKR